jgi:hypothetical protein
VVGHLLAWALASIYSVTSWRSVVVFALLTAVFLLVVLGPSWRASI